MLDDKTVTEHNIEDKSVQEVTAEATKVCCQCGKSIVSQRLKIKLLSMSKMSQGMI